MTKAPIHRPSVSDYLFIDSGEDQISIGPQNSTDSTSTSEDISSLRALILYMPVRCSSRGIIDVRYISGGDSGGLSEAIDSCETNSATRDAGVVLLVVRSHVS